MAKLGLSGRIAQRFQATEITPLLAPAGLLLGLFAVLVTPREEEPQIGILVDDAIVVVENIHRHMAMGRHNLLEAIPPAVDEVGGPSILATFTVIAALLPMAFVTGLMGPYMSPIPINAMGEYLATVPEVTDYQGYAGTAAPINFNGLVRQYYLREGANVGDLQINLLDKHERAAGSPLRDPPGGGHHPRAQHASQGPAARRLRHGGHGRKDRPPRRPVRGDAQAGSGADPETARVSALLLIAALPPTAAETLPVWAPRRRRVGYSRIPRRRRVSHLPNPFVMPIYRGRHLQADGQGVKGIPGESSHFRFDLSVYENVPVAGDNETR